jgi:hypothetical protein
MFAESLWSFPNLLEQTMSEALFATREQLNSNGPAATNGRISAPPSTQVTITLDDKDVAAIYANFFRITSTPEELILDLGLNPQAFSQGNTTVKIGQRVAMNYYTTKRLVGALTSALQRHEKSFGAVEIDLVKRANATEG